MIEILCRKGGTYFPLVQLDGGLLSKGGFSNQFMLRYMGQTAQLYATPSECLRSTPQDDKPEHALNSATGGSPDLGDRSAVENVTIFFATGHSNFESAMLAPCDGNESSNKGLNDEC